MPRIVFNLSTIPTFAELGLTIIEKNDEFIEVEREDNTRFTYVQVADSDVFSESEVRDGVNFYKALF